MTKASAVFLEEKSETLLCEQGTGTITTLHVTKILQSQNDANVYNVVLILHITNQHDFLSKFYDQPRYTVYIYDASIT